MGLYEKVQYVSSKKPFRSIRRNWSSDQVATPESTTCFIIGPSRCQASGQSVAAGAPRTRGCLAPKEGRYASL
jgi:hypothetical protein